LVELLAANIVAEVAAELVVPDLLLQVILLAV
jgi:hypothetical protein